MDNQPLFNSKNKNVAVAIYTALVLTVFAGLMMTLYNRGISVSKEEAFEVENSDIAAIIDEYSDNDDLTKSVSLAAISEAVPSAPKPAWRENAAKTEATHAPKIVVIIDDLGLDPEATNILASIPGPYTLAYLPYADNLPMQTATVKAAGHELMVHLPMQSHRDTADPGKKALLAGLSFDEFGERMEWNLSQFTGYVGINNHMGSKLTEDAALMVRLMARLRRDGLLFVDSLTTPKSVGKRAAKAIDVPFLARDVFLDNERSAEYIKRQLATTERVAKLRGYAIAIGHPYPETLNALKEWQKTLEFKGFKLVAISQIMAEKVDALQNRIVENRN